MSNNSTLWAFEHNVLLFSWLDYVFFSVLFGLSLFVGIYCGCCRKKTASTYEYLLGSRSIGMFPVAMSLIASHVSGITVLGSPTEVYFYGTQYWTSMVSSLLFSIIMMWVFLPVFYQLEVASCYEYLKLRFNSRVQSLALIMYILNTILYVPIVVYIPVLAFSQVSGISIYHTAPIICIICILYTTIGGLRGVVWNDALQLIFTTIFLTVVFIAGVSTGGGFSTIWERANYGNRLEFFNLDADPTVRTTLWGSVFGSAIFFLSSLGVNPSTVQRLISVSSLPKAKICTLAFGVGVCVVLNVTSFFGLIIYAKYFQCDPYISKAIKKPDQILPFYILDITKGVPGLSGLFVTGVFCTALSTMSTHLNTVAGTIYTDLLDIHLPGERSDATARAIIKITVIVIGGLSTALIFVVHKLDGILEICFSFAGIATGPLLGLFTMGMTMPCIDSTGAFIGATVSYILMAWIVIGNQVALMNGSLKYDFLPLKTSGCPVINGSILFNATSTAYRQPSDNAVSWIYRISFYWYTSIGTVLSIMIGLVCCKIISKNGSMTVTNKNLYSPIIHRFFERD